MTWSIIENIVEVEKYPVLNQDVLDRCESQNEGCTSQVLTAWGAALSLCLSGAFGSSTDPYYIQMSGHYNTGHVRPEEGPSDFVFITVMKSAPVPVDE